MGESSLTGAARGLLWAVAGAAVALIAVYLIGVPGHQIPAPAAGPLTPAPVPTPVPQPDNRDPLRDRVDALEKALQQRAEADRQQRSVERAPAKPAVAAPTPRAKPAPQSPKVALAPVDPTPRVAQPVQPPAAQPTPPPVVQPAPPVQPKLTATETLERADRLTARGNYGDAVALLKPLAEQDNPKAQLKLGELTLQGQGTERNEQEGVRLLRKAASLCNSEAQLKLGEMYFRGSGVPQNNFQAYVWYNAAVRSGNPAASGPQERVAALLQPVEVEQASKLAAALSRPKCR
jgi:Sel1 repeat